ncbi:MAG: hypothetical protein M1379_17865 [Firmicutes bacterium]|nr:hypothetical protein [Bacillota bacterium]
MKSPMRPGITSTRVLGFALVMALNRKLGPVQYKYRGWARTISDLDRFLRVNGTTAFIIASGRCHSLRRYFNGYTRDSVSTSFSTAKAFVSL